MSQRISDSLRIVDSHTGGEPTRLLVEGLPDLGTGTMQERMQRLRADADWIRTALVNEPRGSEVIVGGVICEPQDPDALAGVIFFNNVGYLGMCGHGTIGLVRTLQYLGRVQPGSHRIETPVGDVLVTLHEDNRVSVQNVPSYRYRHAVVIDVPGFGPVSGDIAYGGNWFFLIGQHEFVLNVDSIPQLLTFTRAVRQVLDETPIVGEAEGHIDHIELFAKTDPTLADSRNFVLCPGLAYDRSPCGTGTSAKLACLAADGKLQPGEVWRQMSIIGSVFEGSYQWHEDGSRIIPTITGTAFVTADSRLLFDEQDAFARGIPVNDG